MIKAELQKELQGLAEQICRENSKAEIPIIHLKHNRQGHTYYKTGYVSIPIWAIDEGREYLNYYLIHELTHWILGRGHCKAFRHKEYKILSQYGLEPIYSRVYVNVLLKSGRVILDKTKSKHF
jgi:predicted metal-dependent hydrolase